MTPTQLARLVEIVARLSCTTPEMGDPWQAITHRAWDDVSAERDPWRRGLLRAELDAIIAEAYGLSVAEYARILSGFPLLDRDQPPLAGDAFVTEADRQPRGVQGEDWEETPWGFVERKPRSFITRDLALLTYMQRRGVRPPDRLDLFFRDEVGLDPNGPLSRFRIGPHTDLIDRVALAQRRGAVAYVPSGRGGSGASAEEAPGDDGLPGEGLDDEAN
jgi:hypothetical protein